MTEQELMRQLKSVQVKITELEEARSALSESMVTSSEGGLTTRRPSVDMVEEEAEV